MRLLRLLNNTSAGFDLMESHRLTKLLPGAVVLLLFALVVFGTLLLSRYQPIPPSHDSTDKPRQPQVANPTGPTSLPASPRKTVVLPSDIFFKFDSSTLSAAGSQILQAYAKTLDPATICSIKITGHADRLGRAAHNVMLSQARADAVANALQAFQIPPALMVAVGVGSRQAAAATRDCSSDGGRDGLIACLAPSRRVVIEQILR